ncbi:MAG: thioredoxin family protein [Candidatus Micrarchaeota archaeon]
MPRELEIKILGGGCANCKQLEENARKACEELKIKARFEKVSSYEEIAALGVMSLPSLVIDGKVKAHGKIASKEEIKNIILKG